MEDKKENQIESINQEIYPNLNIEELEERLEMTKVMALYCGCDYENCKYEPAS